MKVPVHGRIDRVPAYDPRSGEHFWVALAAYRVDPTRMDEGPMHLDSENLVSLGAVGCYHCEQPYRQQLLHRRCPGEPRAAS